MKNNFKFINILTLAFLTNACSKSFESYPSQIVTDNGIYSNSPNGDSDQNTNFNNDTLINSKTSQQFCSPLKFDQVKWDTSMTLLERRSLAIGLSITGSFEGQNGWNNIANNFDGQGLSAGLLNQTLGTGTLQPLLSNLELNNSTDFKSSFSSQNYSSISAMLKQWRGQKSLKAQSTTSQEDDEDSIPIRPIELEASQFMKLMASQNAFSVNWAVQNLYLPNKNFKPDWKSELMILLNKGSYISLQIIAAQKIHNTALKYVKRIGIYDLRTYLLMFDILVQNGSIKDTRFNDWENYIKINNITDTNKALKALVEIRLKDTNPKWVPDVRSRKYTLIDGLGTVHGRKLNLPKSYCYQLNDQIK